MRNVIVCFLALVCCANFALVADAKDLKGWGIVVMHGKGGKPTQMSSISSALAGAGALVATPTMSWSSGYKTYSTTLDEVAGHISSLRAKGATRIALLGQSLGANVALGYGAQRGGVEAVIAMAPGHFPERFASKSAESLARAKQAVAAGKGNETGSYYDTNQGKEFDIRTTAAAYVSFFDPDGPAVMSRNAANLKVKNLLWIVGAPDANAVAVAKGGKVVTVSGGHFDTPKVSAPQVVEWLQSL